jgi:hypothetical protein
MSAKSSKKVKKPRDNKPNAKKLLKFLQDDSNRDNKPN